MLDSMSLRTTVVNLLATGESQWEILDVERNAFDFILKNRETSQRVAVELVSSVLSAGRLQRLHERLKLVSDIDELWVVSAAKPASVIMPPTTIRLLSLDELPPLLGLAVEGDLSDPRVQVKLQLNAILANVERYKLAPIGVNIDRFYQLAGPSGAQLDTGYFALRRQLPYATIARLAATPGDRSAILALGQKIDPVTVVLSDLKDFSNLVTVSSAEVLQEFMTKYYVAARKLVFDHGGMLDKFIGDAVLAVFGYPLKDANHAVSAVSFAKKLVELGAEILRPWLDEIDADLETGTRVGIATGPIWPVDIGDREVEVSLLGNTINLAARLEHECAVNGILVANKTHTNAEKTDKKTFSTVVISQKTVERDKAKGQPTDVAAWQIGPLFPAIRLPRG